jgi:transposase
MTPRSEDRLHASRDERGEFFFSRDFFLDGLIVVVYLIRMTTVTLDTVRIPALPEQLPSDVETCHALIRLLVSDLAQYKHRVDYLLRRLFGSTSEKIDPNQLVLFKELLEQAVEAAAPPEAIEPPARPRRNGHGRQRLPEDLPRQRVMHDVPDEQKICPNGHERVQIGEDVSEQLDFTPASYYVVEHIRPVYACNAPSCEGGVAQAAKPAQPIEKGLAGPGLLAHVITSKYCDHTPLHRQERIIARSGVKLSRKTLCDWVLQCAGVLKPLVDAMREDVLQSKVIHTDDTPVKVQDPRKKRATHKAYLWPYVGDAHHPYIVFDYTPTRNKDGPETFLETYRGTEDQPRYLQCDAFPGYNGLFAKSRCVFEVACWAHARRKFFEAKDSNPVRANEALIKIGDLYKVEREAKDSQLDAEERRALREKRSKPLLDAFNEWLIALKQDALPKSPIGQAADYALNNWAALERYTTDGDLNIDNNPAEQAVRAIALGRKNWLFFGSDNGGRAAAIHFSLIASARRHNLDPFAYLRDLLARIPTHPNRQLRDLLPNRWKTLEA